MHTMEEMEREMARLSGEGFLFAVFPSETVRNNMAQAQVSASRAEVERLWTAYQRATVEQGLAPYSKDGGGAVAAPLLQSMEKDTGYSRMLVAGFLNALERAVKEQGWDWKWLDPGAARREGLPMTAGESISQAMKKTGQAAGDFLKPTLDPVTNLVKYAAVALVAGAVVYGIYHGTKIFKSKRRKG